MNPDPMLVQSTFSNFIKTLKNLLYSMGNSLKIWRQLYLNLVCIFKLCYVAIFIVSGGDRSTWEHYGLVNFWVNFTDSGWLNILSNIEQNIRWLLRQVRFVDLRYFIVVVLVPFLIELVDDKWCVVTIAQRTVVVHQSVEIILGLHIILIQKV